MTCFSSSENLRFFARRLFFSFWRRTDILRKICKKTFLFEKKKVCSKNGTLFFPKFRWRPKRKSFTENGTLFFPEFKWTLTLRCTPESNYWGECRCRPYSSYWGGYSQIIGEMYPPFPPLPGFRHPCYYMDAWSLNTKIGPLYNPLYALVQRASVVNIWLWFLNSTLTISLVTPTDW